MSERKVPAAELVVGYIGAFVLFPVGLIVGTHLLTRDHREDGIRMIAVASVMGVVSILGTLVIEEDAFVTVAVAIVALLLGISFLVQGRRAAGVAVTAVSLLFGLGIAFQDEFEESNRAREQAQERDEERNERARERVETFTGCLQTLPFKTCLRRFQRELKATPEAAGLSE